MMSSGVCVGDIWASYHGSSTDAENVHLVGLKKRPGFERTPIDGYNLYKRIYCVTHLLQIITSFQSCMQSRPETVAKVAITVLFGYTDIGLQRQKVSWGIMRPGTNDIRFFLLLANGHTMSLVFVSCCAVVRGIFCPLFVEHSWCDFLDNHKPSMLKVLVRYHASKECSFLN